MSKFETSKTPYFTKSYAAYSQAANSMTSFYVIRQIKMVNGKWCRPKVKGKAQFLLTLFGPPVRVWFAIPVT